MSVVPVNQINRTRRLQGRWDRRDVAELSQTNFHTTMRGFDRDEVRAVLDSVAADYRVLQLQNASLQRQLTHLEAVLQDYQREHNGSASLAMTQVLQRTNDEARAALSRAQMHAEETIARITAYAREAECRVAQLEEDRRHFRTLLVSTVSEMITILGRYQYPIDPLVLEMPQFELPTFEMPAAPLKLEEPVTRALAGNVAPTPQGHFQPAPAENPAQVEKKAAPPQDNNADSVANTAPPVASMPVTSIDRDTTRRADDTDRARTSFASESKKEKREREEPIRSILRDLDMALIRIPALASE
jgi:DivIVA domain-containing protein